MAKGKSSATSATRKKHARKAAGPVLPPETVPKEKKQKGKEKGKNKEPRQKVYIAPVKPAPIQPDPLDALGLARQLPPELLVVLRLLGKKDTVTKRRALEELQFGWVDESIRGGDDSPMVETLMIMLPVWVRLRNYMQYSFQHSKCFVSFIMRPRCLYIPRKDYDSWQRVYRLRFYIFSLSENSYFSSCGKLLLPIKLKLSLGHGVWHVTISTGKSHLLP